MKHLKTIQFLIIYITIKILLSYTSLSNLVFLFNDKLMTAKIIPVYMLPVFAKKRNEHNTNICTNFFGIYEILYEIL